MTAPHTAFRPEIGTPCVIVGRYNNFRTTVQKVSPTGRITVGYHTGSVAVFVGKTNYAGHHPEHAPHSIYARDNRVLRFDVAAVDAEESALKRAQEAANALRVVARAAEDLGRARHEWSKDAMAEMLVKLEAEIEVARAAINAR